MLTNNRELKIVCSITYGLNRDIVGNNCARAFLACWSHAACLYIHAS